MSTLEGMKRLVVVAVVFLLTHLIRVQACSKRPNEDERLSYLADRIAHEDFGMAPGHPFDGEWKLTTLSMASIAATNLAMRHPEARAERARQVSGWAAKLSSPEVRAYDTTQWGTDAFTTLERSEAHAGYLGHVVLALDAACLLGGPRDAALHEQLVNALARRISESPTGLIETYPGEIYVPDNLVVMAALVQFDACVQEPRHADLTARWIVRVKAQWLDPHTGLLVFAPGQKARGSGAAWNSFYLPLVDEPFAAEQSALMWATFGDTVLGGWLHGIREWPIGEEGAGDVDSGPLVMGVSPSATGFALADATLRARAAKRAGILRIAELMGVTWNGRYLCAPLVGDAVVLAATTMTRWVGEYPPRQRALVVTPHPG